MENNFQIASAAVSDIGLNEKRPQNEDSYLEMRQRGVFAVADGVGGAQAGDVASQMAMEILGEAFVNFNEGGDAEELMKLAIERANGAIYQMSHELPQLSTMATTLVSLHVAGNIATIGHVGDSRMYRLDGNGSLFRETQDHSIVEEEVRAGRMTAEQAANHPSRNVISRALGAEPTVEIDMKTIMFEPETAFLLCSDGITRHINDFEIRELLTLDTGPADICERMKRICYERGAEDNLTAVVVKISAEAARHTPEQDSAVFLDLEEATVATARPAADEESIDGAETISDYDEAETRELRMPVAREENFIAPEEIEESEGDEVVYEIAPDPPEAPAAPVPGASPHPSVESALEKEYSMFGSSGTETVEPVKSSGGGTVGRILSSVIVLILGAILGVAAYSYLMPRPVAEQPRPDLATPPVGPDFKTFEEARRLVDADPAKYISANAVTPHDAVDYYLLGRAYLVTGNYTEAREKFSEARKRSQEIPEINRKSILNEIAMAMVILDNPIAQSALTKEISTNALSNSNTNTNTRTNSNR